MKKTNKKKDEIEIIDDKPSYKKTVILTITITLSVLLIAILFYCLYNYISSNNNKKEIKNEISELQNNNYVNEIIDELKEDNKLLYANIKSLKEINKDIVGWIKITNEFNIPYVKGNNNSYYLNHSLKDKNENGWLFLDYRNNINFDKNNILYLKKENPLSIYLDDIIKNINDTREIKICNDTITSTWQIFNIHEEEINNNYLKINFTEDEFISFINNINNKELEISKEDKILTISIIDNEKLELIYAKLINTKEIEKPE